MKNKIILATLLYTSIATAQDDKKKIWFGQDFELGGGIINVAANESMMGDAHTAAPLSLFLKAGIFHYQQFTIGIHANISGMRVKDPQYYGVFERTNTFTIGPYVSYFQPISEELALEPYLSYDYTEYTAKSGRKELNFNADGLGIGLDLQYKAADNFFVLFGLKYTISTLDAKTHPDWQKYLHNYNFLSAKIAFKFAKYRF